MICYLRLLGLFLYQTPNCGCEDKPQITVLAVVNGVKITKQQLSVDTRSQVNLIQETVIAARSQALNQLIARMLLETEAKRREWLSRDVSAAIEPTAAPVTSGPAP